MKKAFIAISTAFLLSWAQVPVRAETKIPKCSRSDLLNHSLGYKIDKVSDNNFKLVVALSVYINEKVLSLKNKRLVQYAENYARYLAQKDLARFIDSEDKDGLTQKRVALGSRVLKLCRADRSELLIAMEISSLDNEWADLMIDYEELVNTLPPTNVSDAEYERLIDMNESRLLKQLQNIERLLIKNFRGQ